MLTKQQIADEFKALETEVHALCTQAWTSMNRHTVIKQMPKRRELMAACEATGGHVFAVSGRCKFCKASDDRPNVANLGVATGVVAGLSEAPVVIEQATLIEANLTDRTCYGVPWDSLFHRTAPQPAPEVISKAPDALPAGSFYVKCDEFGPRWSNDGIEWTQVGHIDITQV